MSAVQERLLNLITHLLSPAKHNFSWEFCISLFRCFIVYSPMFNVIAMPVCNSCIPGCTTFYESDSRLLQTSYRYGIFAVLHQAIDLICHKWYFWWIFLYWIMPFVCEWVRDREYNINISVNTWFALCYLILSWYEIIYIHKVKTLAYILFVRSTVQKFLSLFPPVWKSSVWTN